MNGYSKRTILCAWLDQCFVSLLLNEQEFDKKSQNPCLGGKKQGDG
jgi:hypothetical protein